LKSKAINETLSQSVSCVLKAAVKKES